MPRPRRKNRRGQGLCGFVMGLTFTLVASIFFYRYFVMTTTLHMVEETMSDPTLPFLQSLSYSTTNLECGGKWVRIYDLLPAAAAGNSGTVTACGEEVDLGKEVGLQLKYLETLSDICFEYKLADSANKELQILKFGDCAAKIAAEKKAEKSRTQASYLFPLPPEKGFMARSVLTTVKSMESTATPTPTPTP